MTFCPISFISEPYSSKYGSKGLQSKFTVNSTAAENTKPDTFKGKYYKQKKVNTMLATIGGILSAAFVIGACKGKAPAKGLTKGIGSIFSKIGKTILAGFTTVGSGIWKAGKGIVTGILGSIKKVKP